MKIYLAEIGFGMPSSVRDSFCSLANTHEDQLMLEPSLPGPDYLSEDSEKCNNSRKSTGKNSRV